jgi:hypothetical protein
VLPLLLLHKGAYCILGGKLQSVACAPSSQQDVILFFLLRRMPISSLKPVPRRLTFHASDQ